MITEHDLQEAIEETQGKRDPNANDCIKLAAFYTIRNELFGAKSQHIPSLSYAASPADTHIDYNSGTEFSAIVNGRLINEVLEKIDKCLTELSFLNPRLYNDIIDEIS